MAYIKRNNSRHPLSEGGVIARVSQPHDDGDLQFRIEIGDIQVRLTQTEKQHVVSTWASSLKAFEK